LLSHHVNWLIPHQVWIQNPNPKYQHTHHNWAPSHEQPTPHLTKISHHVSPHLFSINTCLQTKHVATNITETSPNTSLSTVCFLNLISLTLFSSKWLCFLPLVCPSKYHHSNASALSKAITSHNQLQEPHFQKNHVEAHVLNSPTTTKTTYIYSPSSFLFLYHSHPWIHKWLM